MKAERTEPDNFDFDPEIELIIAVYRRARLDLIWGKGATQKLAGLFLLSEGINPAAVQRAWRPKPMPGRPRSAN